MVYFVVVVSVLCTILGVYALTRKGEPTLEERWRLVREWGDKTVAEAQEKRAV